MVATIVLPRARALPDVRAALAAFEAFERRFVAELRPSIFARWSVRLLRNRVGRPKVSVGGTSGPTGGARRAAVVAHL
jgi:hypothetical protein